MHMQLLTAVVLVAVALSAQALPAKRDLPGQTLHLDATQVAPACVSQLSIPSSHFPTQFVICCSLTCPVSFPTGQFSTIRTTPDR